MTAAAGSLLSVADLTLDQVSEILALASILEAEPPALRAQHLFKRRVALLFYESSTRTRTSFELAAKSLGADTALISSKSSSIEKGESLKDTGLTLRALGAEAIILRHGSSGSAHLLAQFTNLPVLNAGDGMHEHPSQALLDLRTILTRLYGPAGANEASSQSLAGVTITICGDILHSRVARSNALLLPRLGARVIFCGPAPLLPSVAAEIGGGARPGMVSIERDFDHALAQSQVVMMLRIQAERLAGLHLDLDEYKANYQAGVERIARHPALVVMHPGPIIRGLEIASEVADGPQSVIEEQVRHGVSIRMALVARALGIGIDSSGAIPGILSQALAGTAILVPPMEEVIAMTPADPLSLPIDTEEADIPSQPLLPPPPPPEHLQAVAERGPIVSEGRNPLWQGGK